MLINIGCSSSWDLAVLGQLNRDGEYRCGKMFSETTNVKGVAECS